MESAAFAAPAKPKSPRSEAKAELSPGRAANPASAQTPRAAKKNPTPVKPNHVADDRVAPKVAPIPAVGAPAESSPADSRSAPRVRNRTIFARYVTGDEPKPGERWKHRLRKSR